MRKPPHDRVNRSPCVVPLKAGSTLCRDKVTGSIVGSIDLFGPGGWDPPQPSPSKHKRCNVNTGCVIMWRKALLRSPDPRPVGQLSNVFRRGETPCCSAPLLRAD